MLPAAPPMSRQNPIPTRMAPAPRPTAVALQMPEIPSERPKYADPFDDPFFGGGHSVPGIADSGSEPAANAPGNVASPPLQRAPLEDAAPLAPIPEDIDGPALAIGTGLTQEQVCRAAIGAVMRRDIRIVRPVMELEGVSYLSYFAERQEWRYKCRVNGRSVQWGMAEGRWRTHPLDGTVTFERAPRSLVIRQQHADGSGDSQSFALDSL